MTTSLRAVTLQTVANYRHAAERTLGASRHTGERLIAVVRASVERAARAGAEPYVPAFAAALRRAGDNLGSLAGQGLAAVSERTSRAIAAGADGVVTQVERVAGLVDGVDSKVVASGLQAAVRVSLPGAQVALALSERVASGADKLADVAGAGTARRTARAAGKRVRRAKAEAADVAATAATDATGANRQARRSRAAVVAAAEVVAETVKAPKVAKAVKPVKAAAKPAKAEAAKPARVRRAAKPVAAAPVAEVAAEAAA
jgi:hypothetical protein